MKNPPQMRRFDSEYRRQSGGISKKATQATKAPMERRAPRRKMSQS